MWRQVRGVVAMRGRGSKGALLSFFETGVLKKSRKEEEEIPIS